MQRRQLLYVKELYLVTYSFDQKEIVNRKVLVIFYPNFYHPPPHKLMGIHFQVKLLKQSFHYVRIDLELLNLHNIHR